ncbi:MAG: VOC family protein [Candidatus Andersenbacteria bacterium]
MKIRTIYFKVKNVKKAAAFWEGFLGVKPHKTFDEWYEFMTDNIRLGLYKNTGDKFAGSNCIPVFEFSDAEVGQYVERAKELGAKVLFDSLNDPDVLSVGFRDPFGHEFEVSKFHN